MKKKILPCLFLFCLIFSEISAQSWFYKRYSAGNSLFFSRLQKTNDNGWLVAQSGYIIKYDECGNIAWTKATGMQVGDFNLCGGGSMLLSTFSGNPTLMKLDSNANVINTYQFSSGAYTHFVYSSGEFSNGDMFISGIAELQQNGPYRYFIIKTDASGNIKWNIGFDDPCCWGYGTACNDGGVLVRSGSITYKTDSAGNMQWTKIYGGTSYSLKPLEVNDGFIFAKYSESNQPDTAFLYKTDKQGNLLWVSQSFYANDLMRIVKMSNGNFMSIGSMKTNITQYRHIPTLVEVSPSGNFVSQTAYPKPLPAPDVIRGEDFCLLDDGTVAFTGREFHFANNSNTSNLFVAKTGKKGRMCNDSAITAYYPPRSVTVMNYSVTASNLPFVKSNLSYNSASYQLSEQPVCKGYDSISFSFNNIPCMVPGNTISLSGPPGRHYLWSNGSVSQSISVTTPGQYYLTVIDPCSGDSVVAGAVVYLCEPVGIASYNKSLSVIVYPNPTNGRVAISGVYNSLVEVTSPLGETVFSGYTGNEQFYALNLAHQEKGVYFLKVRTNGQTVTRKILLDK